MIKIGSRLHKLRKDRKITLIELSKATGVAQATLSRIETEDMTGTVHCHQKLANAMGLCLSELYDGVDGRHGKTYSAKVEEAPILSKQNERVRMEVRTSKALKKKLFPLVITLKGNSQTEEERGDRSNEKFVYVTEGEVVINLSKQDYPLKQDESLYFDGSLPHTIFNKSSKPAKLVAVSSSPS